jgi:hypothetical protein
VLLPIGALEAQRHSIEPSPASRSLPLLDSFLPFFCLHRSDAISPDAFVFQLPSILPSTHPPIHSSTCTHLFTHSRVSGVLAFHKAFSEMIPGTRWR